MYRMILTPPKGQLMQTFFLQQEAWSQRNVSSCITYDSAGIQWYNTFDGYTGLSGYTLFAFDTANSTICKFGALGAAFSTLVLGSLVGAVALF